MHDDLPRLIGAHEIRELLGVSRQRAYQLAARSDFPKPVAHLAQGKIWTEEEVAVWIEARRARGHGVAVPTGRASPTLPVGEAPPIDEALPVGDALQVGEAVPMGQALV